MRRIWKGLAMLAPLALVGGLFIALPAQATHEDEHDIESGNHVANCGVNGNAPVTPDPDEHPGEEGIPFQGQQIGTFTFDSLLFTCAVTTEDDPETTGIAVLDVEASGSYNNTGPCGTGTAVGHGEGTLVGDTVPPGFADEFPADADFHIGFTSGVGIMTLGEHTPAGGDAHHGSRAPNDPPPFHGGWGDGAVDILPTPPVPPNAQTCATGFVVNGAFQLVLEHDASH